MTLEERITKTKNNSEICRFRRIYILVIPFSKGIFGQNVRKYTPHNWGRGIMGDLFSNILPNDAFGILKRKIQNEDLFSENH